MESSEISIYMQYVATAGGLCVCSCCFLQYIHRVIGCTQWSC